MSCVQPDGKPTESGRKMLQALSENQSKAEEVAAKAGLPLFRVRSGLRDMVQADYAEQTGEAYRITSKGLKVIE